MPIWSLFLCLFMAFASILPLGIIRAVAGSSPQINVPAQFIIGLFIPGNTVGVMTFKSLGTNIVYQALLFLSQLKLGHYMKINPKHMVYAQLYGTTLGAIFSTSTFFFLLDAIKGLLGTAEWLVSDYSIFYNAAAIWVIFIPNLQGLDWSTKILWHRFSVSGIIMVFSVRYSSTYHSLAPQQVLSTIILSIY